MLANCKQFLFLVRHLPCYIFKRRYWMYALGVTTCSEERFGIGFQFVVTTTTRPWDLIQINPSCTDYAMLISRQIQLFIGDPLLQRKLFDRVHYFLWDSTSVPIDLSKFYCLIDMLYCLYSCCCKYNRNIT